MRQLPSLARCQLQLLPPTQEQQPGRLCRSRGWERRQGMAQGASPQGPQVLGALQVTEKAWQGEAGDPTPEHAAQAGRPGGAPCPNPFSSPDLCWHLHSVPSSQSPASSPTCLHSNQQTLPAEPADSHLPWSTLHVSGPGLLFLFFSSFFKISFICLRGSVTDSERERRHPLVHFQNGHNSQS